MNIKVTFKDGNKASLNNIKSIESFYCTGFERHYYRITCVNGKVVEQRKDNVISIVIEE